MLHSDTPAITCPCYISKTVRQHFETNENWLVSVTVVQSRRELLSKPLMWLVSFTEAEYAWGGSKIPTNGNSLAISKAMILSWQPHEL